MAHNHNTSPNTPFHCNTCPLPIPHEHANVKITSWCPTCQDSMRPIIKLLTRLTSHYVDNHAIPATPAPTKHTLNPLTPDKLKEKLNSYILNEIAESLAAVLKMTAMDRAKEIHLRTCPLTPCDHVMTDASVLTNPNTNLDTLLEALIQLHDSSVPPHAHTPECNAQRSRNPNAHPTPQDLHEMPVFRIERNDN